MNTNLSPEQMDQWENDGYLLLKGVVPEAAINGVRSSFSRVVDGIINELKADRIIEDEGLELPFETRLAQVAGEHANRFGRSCGTKWRPLKFRDTSRAVTCGCNRATHRDRCHRTSRFQCASKTPRSAIDSRPMASGQWLFRHSQRNLAHPDCVDTLGTSR